MDREFEQVISGELPMSVAVKYLSVYVGTPTAGDWQDHIGRVWRKIKHKPNAAEEMRNILAHAILIATTDKSIDIGEIPENFFHKSTYFRQLNEHDWFAQLQKIVAEDAETTKRRAEAQSLGVIDPIEFQPYTRQAYNWLYAKAEETGAITPETKERVSRLLKNLVYAYGGATICSVFTNHAEWLPKIHNWRTGYFFERVLHKVYTPEQIIKIKKQELSKTNANLVKRIRTD